jgi:hypothetical protein
MARSLEAATAPSIAAAAISDLSDMIDLLERGGDGAPFDPSYGETLRELLPRDLSELSTRH